MQICNGDHHVPRLLTAFRWGCGDVAVLCGLHFQNGLSSIYHLLLSHLLFLIVSLTFVERPLRLIHNEHPTTYH